LLIFVLAILGSIGVVYAGFQLYHEDLSSEAKPDLGKNEAKSQKVENKTKHSPLAKASFSSHKKNTNKETLFSSQKGRKPLVKEVKKKEPLPPKNEKLPKEKLQKNKVAATSKAEKSQKQKPSNDTLLEKALQEELSKKAARLKKNTSNIGYANPKEPKKKRSFLNFWKKEESSKAELLGEIMPPISKFAPKKEAVQSMPELIPEQLTLRSPKSINLKLKVKGNKLFYKSLSQGSYNELKINYQPAIGKLSSKQDEYPTGNSVIFSINGENVISKTYQFTVYFRDASGNIYSQQIAGLGREYPIIDKPQLAKKI
ncbi:MAG: hypothetical protein AAF696_21020, partial [Bacteroidota bacterium]